MAAKIRMNTTDNSSSLRSVLGKQYLLVLQYNNNGRGRDVRRKLGIHGKGGMGKNRVEECEMFTQGDEKEEANHREQKQAPLSLCVVKQRAGTPNFAGQTRG